MCRNRKKVTDDFCLADRHHKLHQHVYWTQLEAHDAEVHGERWEWQDDQGVHANVMETHEHH